MRQGHYERAEQLMLNVEARHQALGDAWAIAVSSQNLAWLYVETGRVEEAHHHARRLIDQILSLRDPGFIIEFAETFVEILARLGDTERAARLLGAAGSMRLRNTMPRPDHVSATIEAALAAARVDTAAQHWDYHYLAGVGQDVEDILLDLR
jgi:hypothetical protein